MLMTTNLKTKHNSERFAAPALDYQSSEKPTSHRKRKRKRISEEGRYIRLEFSLLKVVLVVFESWQHALPVLYRGLTSTDSGSD